MRVRIKNFQSIEDAEIEISGFTVITGTNNSGKTAVMRAIRGVFTNAPAGSLLRHGAAYLSVTLYFDDGNTVTWEKGWEKPNRKGKTVNRYIVNGKTLPNVGRRAPEEVLQLGVGEVHAGSDRFWPQFAEQVTGSLFLVDRPGSVMAEALSDVERVGKLSSALRMAESDRRSTSDRLRVRREDLDKARTRLDHYKGLDDVLPLADALRARKVEIDSLESSIAEQTALLQRLRRARAAVDAFEGFDPHVVPDAQPALATSTDLRESRTLLKALMVRKDAALRFEGWEGSTVLPPTGSLIELSTKRKQCSDLNVRLSGARSRLARMPTDIPTLPDSNPVVRVQKAIGIIESLRTTLKERADAVALLDVQTSERKEEQTILAAKITTLLGDRGSARPVVLYIRAPRTPRRRR